MTVFPFGFIVGSANGTETFRELLCGLLEHYRLSPEKAAVLLERILAALGENERKEGERNG